MKANDLLEPLSEKAKALEVGEVYEHYKKKYYKLISVGRHSESLEEVVVYQALYGDQGIWVRPLEMFLENVNINGQEVPRFKQVSKNETLKISLYLAGNIQKGHERESQVFWTDDDRDILRKGLAPNKIAFLNPALRSDDLSDQKSVFGRDMTQVYCASAVFVDARERRGLGVGAEMMWAKMNRIPVLTLAPRNSHYYKGEVTLLGVTVKNWVHPFVESLSDVIVEELAQGVEWLKNYLDGKFKIKGPEFMHEAMKHYQETQFPNDLTMRKIFEENPKLRNYAPSVGIFL